MQLRVILLACSVPLVSAFTVPGGSLTPSAAALSGRRWGVSCRAGASARSSPTPRGVLDLRAAGEDGGKKEPADGSIEKILSGLGPLGSKVGAGVDWCDPKLQPNTISKLCWPTHFSSSTFPILQVLRHQSNLRSQGMFPQPSRRAFSLSPWPPASFSNPETLLPSQGKRSHMQRQYPRAFTI